MSEFFLCKNYICHNALAQSVACVHILLCIYCALGTLACIKKICNMYRMKGIRDGKSYIGFDPICRNIMCIDGDRDTTSLATFLFH